MDFNSNLLNTLKCISNESQFSNEAFEILVKSVFDSFIINSKNRKLELYLDKKTIGNLIFLITIMNCITKDQS
jgi:hypothetical protein